MEEYNSLCYFRIENAEDRLEGSLKNNILKKDFTFNNKYIIKYEDKKLSISKNKNYINNFFCIEDENMYPYKFGINKIRYFSYKPNSIENYEIITLKGTDPKMDNNAKVFLIEDIYKKAHSNVVDDLIEKRKKYSKLYIDELSQLKGIKITDEEVKYFLGYSREENVSNVSLGKLKNDIIDEIMQSKL